MPGLVQNDGRSTFYCTCRVWIKKIWQKLKKSLVLPSLLNPSLHGTMWDFFDFGLTFPHQNSFLHHPFYWHFLESGFLTFSTLEKALKIIKKKVRPKSWKSHIWHIWHFQKPKPGNQTITTSKWWDKVKKNSDQTLKLDNLNNRPKAL